MANWPIPRAAVIPTNGRDCLEQCLDAILPQVDFAVIVETDKERLVPARNLVYKIWDYQGVNISRWWREGLSEVRRKMEHLGGVLPSQRKYWDVAILNDDAIVPDNWFSAVAYKMREMRAAAASSSDHAQMPVLYTRPGPVNLFERMNGYAFIVRGELGLMPNEKFTWYCSDDHMDWMARENGGTVVIPGYPVKHLYPNAQVTPEIQEQIAEDMRLFVEHWGMRPW